MSEHKNLFLLEIAKTSIKKNTIDDLLKEAGLKRRRNYFYVAFYLATEGKNDNGLIFKEEQILENFDSIVGTPVNWDHNRYEKIGTHIYSKVEEVNGKKYVVALAMFYEKDDMYYNSKIKERHQGGTLRFSMEADVKVYECNTCHKLWDTDEWGTSCSCLFSDKGRIAKEFLFVGSGVVENPADKKAKSIDLANKQSKKGDEMEEKMIKLTEEIASLKADLKQKEEVISNLTKENESVKSELAESKKSVEEKEVEVAKLTSEKEEVSKKLLEIEQEKKEKEREMELKDLNIPETLAEEKASALKGSDEDFARFVKVVKVFNEQKEEKASVKTKVEGKKETEAEEKKEENKIKSLKDLF